MKQSLIFLVLLLSIKNTTYAQLVELNQTPLSIKWNQINTPHFRLVYPNGFDSTAQQMANTLEHIYTPVSNELGKQPRKISVIFQNQNTIPNAYVRLAPRYSEFYTTPPQDYNSLGTNSWLNLLCTHEFRHIVQYDKSLTGFTKLAYYLFGQGGWAVMSYLAAPEWFWEGDAVYSETLFSESGRGRIPFFDLVFRTQLLERGRWNYHKQYLRSFKDFIPNHYVTGYFMTSYLRRSYGDTIWDKVTERAFRRSYMPFTFSKAIKKYTGHHLVPTYNKMTQELDSLWRKQIDQLVITPSIKITKRKTTTFTNYEHPQTLSDGCVVVEKSGLGDIATFIAVDSIGNEKKLVTLGLHNESGMLSIAHDIIVWNEFIPDQRWGNKWYSVIKRHDIKTQKTKQLTEKSRFNGAAISSNGNSIVTIETNENNKHALVILDAQSGTVIKRLTNPSNCFYVMPRWMADNKHIVTIALTDKGKAITLINTQTEQSFNLTAFSYENIGHPVAYKNYIFFNSPYNGIDNIYVLDTLTHRRFQVTSKKYGAYNPVISNDGKHIYFTNFSISGMDLEKMELDSARWTPIEQVENRTMHYYQKDTLNENNIQKSQLLQSTPHQTYDVKKYKRINHLINPFGWGPYIDGTSRNLGIYLQSIDILQTLYTRVGYTRNANEKTNGFAAEASYQGLYSMIDAGYQSGTRLTTLNYKNNDTLISWKEKTGFIGLSLPLNLTRSKYYQYLKFSTRINITQVSNYEFPVRYISQAGNGGLRSLQYFISYSRLLKISKRDIQSRWGQSLFIMYNHTPLGGDYKSDRLAIEGNLFFPGLGKHHSLQVRGGYQKQTIDNYAFSTPLFIPRGDTYKSYASFSNASIEYRLPLFYPDIAIGPLVNIQRVKANLFYDYSMGWDNTDKKTTFSSMGVELTTDINVFRLLATNIDLGARFTYVPDTQAAFWDFLLLSFGF